jgi:hypothetical protein
MIPLDNRQEKKKSVGHASFERPPTFLKENYDEPL